MGPAFIPGDFSTVQFRNMSALGPENFAMVTLELADIYALRTIRSKRLNFTGGIIFVFSDEAVYNVCFFKR